MAATSLLRVTRRLALVAVVLSILVLPLGASALVSGLSPDIGDNGMGDTLALVAGITLLILGSAGAILGVVLALLARRTLPDPVEIHGSRRRVLATGLVAAGIEVLVATAIGGGWVISAGLIAAYAVGFLVVAVTTRERGRAVLAGAITLALLAVGFAPLVGQASQNDAGGRRDARVALLPTDWQAALSAAAAPAPDGWAVPTLTARVTDFAPSAEGIVLPPGMGERSLRGIVVVDCAGAQTLEVVARDPDASAEEAPIVLGTVTCDPEPQVLSIDIPGVALHTNPSGTYVLGIALDPVDEGPAGGMNRAVFLVAAAGTPDPTRDELLATFVAAFGTEAPR